MPVKFRLQFADTAWLKVPGMAQGAMYLSLPALSTVADACEHSRATAATATAQAVMNCVKAKPLEKTGVKNRKS